MTALMFQILKMNVAAAVMISVAIGIGHFTKDRYSSKWKYCMWLIIMRVATVTKTHGLPVSE